MRKDYKYIAIYIVIVLCLLLAAGEIYARITYKQSYLTGLFVSDPVFHHLAPPHYKGHMHSENEFDIAFRTNNIGMRGPVDYVYEKGTGTFRIAVLGDSFIFGVGVNHNETMCYLLEDLLNRSGQNRYEVYNFGVNSYSPILEYIYLKKEVIKYKPDMVILILDISDVQDDYFYEPHVVYDANGDIAACDPFLISGRPDLRAFCMRYSRLFYILDQKLFQSFRKMKTIGFVNYFSNKLKGRRTKTEILTNKEIDNVYFDRFLLFREGKSRDVVMRHWQRTARYLTMIKEYLDRQDIKFILVTYPYGHQVGANQWPKGRLYWGFERDRIYDPKEGFAVMADFAGKSHIDFINLYDAMIKANGEKLYFDSDGHWTKKGHEVAAEAIFDSHVFQRDLR